MCTPSNGRGVFAGLISNPPAFYPFLTITFQSSSPFYCPSDPGRPPSHVALRAQEVCGVWIHTRVPSNA
uniref:Uncharacterized protein n=1 Tax=Leishmania guyanensis TaxID=5670 RepID=A0A1E1J6M7_LEIGU|nr:Hypothetical protein BN36_3467480 [Leishmania guyanensis]